MKKATSKDWKIHPLPKKRSLIPVDRHFTPAEMNCIRRGFIPQNARWFIFFERNRLYFHRSWTGVCVFVAHFKRRQNGYVLHLIEANRNRKQYSETADVSDTKLCFELVDNFLLEPQAQSNENKGPAGFVAALDQASKPNYLGDPEVVGNLLRKYRDAAVESRKSKMDPEERIACDHGYALAMADIFLGKVLAFAPMIPWNSPGQIDRWIANELHRPGFDGQTPEQTVANAMACYLNDFFDLAKIFIHSPKPDDWVNTEMEKIDTRYVHLLLGLPNKEKKPEPTDDELCEDDDEP
jgi:hypothetical protein